MKKYIAEQNNPSSGIVEVENLTYTYEGKSQPAVNGISFTIQEGEIFGFLGPNGAGKSTTQKILMKLSHYNNGGVRIFGKTLDSWGADYYERIGVSFELPNHYQKLTALENLNFFRSLYKNRGEDPMALLDMVGLAQDAHRRVSQFSKGMQSRLTFIRALLNGPDLVFLDEPTSGLDPVNARIVKNIIRDLKSKGRTIFLTTHDMHTAEELCDRVAFLTKGKIVAIDTPRSLKMQRSRAILHMEYFQDNQMMRADFNLKELQTNKDFFRIIKTCSIETMHTQEATLEDIFAEVTGEGLQ